MKTWAVVENGIREFDFQEIKRVFILRTIVCILLGFALGYLAAYMQY